MHFLASFFGLAFRLAEFSDAVHVKHPNLGVRSVGANRGHELVPFRIHCGRRFWILHPNALANFLSNGTGVYFGFVEESEGARMYGAIDLLPMT